MTSITNSQEEASGSHVNTLVSQPKLSNAPLTPSAALKKPMIKHHKPSALKLILDNIVRAYLTGYAVAVLPSVVIAAIQSLILKRKRASVTSDPFHVHVGGILVSSLKARLTWFLVVLVAGFRTYDLFFSWLAKRYITNQVSVLNHLIVIESPVTRQTPKTSTSIPSADIFMGSSAIIRNTDSSIENIGKIPMAPLSPTPPQPSMSSIRLVTTFAAAALSAGTALLIIPPERRTDFALLAVVRAADSFMKYKERSIKAALKNHGVSDVAVQNGDTLLFVMSCTVIMWSWFYHQYALPKSYFKWISAMSELDPVIHTMLNRLKSGELVYHQQGPYVEACKIFAKKVGLPEIMGDASLGMINCRVVHQGVEGCLNHTAKRWKCGFKRSFRLYFPVHFLPVILFHPSRFIKPRELPSTIWKILLGTTQSSIFLATFIAMVWGPICFFRNNIMKGRDREVFGVFMGCFLSGFSLFLERKSRRREVALFCAPKALESAWRQIWPKRGRANGLMRHSDIIMFALAMGYITTAYMHLQGGLRGPIRALMQWFIDEPIHF